MKGLVEQSAGPFSFARAVGMTAAMQKTLLAVAAAALAFTSSASAQSAQDKLDERYNLALAAGYKALFLCGAIANAERNGVNRPVDSVEMWELTGVYPQIDPIVRELPHRIVRIEQGMIGHVEVDWADDMPPRFAKASFKDGCKLAPIGLDPEATASQYAFPPGFEGSQEAEILRTFPRREDGGLLFPPPVPFRIVSAEYAPLLTMARDPKYGEGARTTAVVIQHRGLKHASHTLMAREGWEERKDITDWAMGFDTYTPQRTWSVAKSIAATLVGVAAYKGQIDVNAPGVREEWMNDARNAITVDHLLRMASGRYSDTPGNRTDPLYAGGALVEETATDWPLIHKPGTVFRYANNDTLMAVKAVSDRVDDFDPEAFFKLLGMNSTVAETDWAGDYILSSQVWTTAEDLAKLGQLYLNDGVLPDGTRILPEGWVEYVSTPSGPQPDGAFGYGAGWWLMNKSEGIPPDTIAAFGNRGQYLVIVPSLDLVIVRRGEDPVGARFDIAAFTRDVIAGVARLP